MRLTKIYTKTGDKGKTRLADGTEVSKDSASIQASGEVDELNSLLGVVIAQNPSRVICDSLSAIQHHLFDLGGELSAAGSIDNLITPEMVSELESQIDDLNSELEPLKEFILPGGTPAAANLHLCRTVCRRAERSIITLGISQAISADLFSYINRLSDLLFVMARHENQVDGNNEIYWKNPRK